MSAANKKYQQIKQYEIARQAREYQEQIKNSSIIPARINTQEQVCKKCGFKAKYKFIRCPECETLQV